MPIKKIAIVGPIPRDTITTHHGEVIKKYGCVTHPTIALAKLLDGQGEVIPISHVHQIDHAPIVKLFSKHSNINTKGIYSDKEAGTIIELKFIDQNNRLEHQMANMHPISPQDIAPFLDVDCFVFVPITDFEIELKTLQHIKQHSSAKVIFDAHGPTTFVDKTGSRLRKYWGDRDDWLPHIDILKMNLEESLCCWFDKDHTDEALFDENNTQHLDDFAALVIGKGVNVLYVTLDSRGCVVYQKSNQGYTKDFIGSITVQNVIDTTGCGDSFAGGLAYGFAMYDNAVKAGHYANALGAMRTQGKTFDVFKTLEETNKLIADHY